MLMGSGISSDAQLTAAGVQDSVYISFIAGHCSGCAVSFSLIILLHSAWKGCKENLQPSKDKSCWQSQTQDFLAQEVIGLPLDHD
jgi:hypothetical protein